MPVYCGYKYEGGKLGLVLPSHKGLVSHFVQFTKYVTNLKVGDINKIYISYSALIYYILTYTLRKIEKLGSVFM
jgi:hypothetical protein